MSEWGAGIKTVLGVSGLESYMAGMKAAGGAVDTFAVTSNAALKGASAVSASTTAAMSARMFTLGATMRAKGKEMSMALTLPLIGMGVVGVKRLDDIQKSSMQTSKQLKITGASAWITAKGIDQIAMSTERSTGMDRLKVKSAEDMLLVFTNVRNSVGKNNDIFTRATNLSADLSVKLGMDIPSAAKILGKALQEPATGMMALSRVIGQLPPQLKQTIKGLTDGVSASKALFAIGVPLTNQQDTLFKKYSKTHDSLTALKMAHVQLTAAQTEMFDKLTHGGHMIEAQNLLLQNLEKRIGGLASAVPPLSKNLHLMKSDFEDASATLVAGFMPQIEGTAKSVDGLFVSLSHLSPGTKSIVIDAALAAAALGPLAWAIGAVTTVGGAAIAVSGALAAGLTGIGSAAAMMTVDLAAAGGAMEAIAGVMAINPLLTGAIVVGGIIAAGVAIAELASNAHEAAMNTDDAARAIKNLETTGSGMANTGLRVQQSALGVQQAQAGVTSATAVVGSTKDGTPAHTQAVLAEKAAVLQLKQAELDLTSAVTANNSQVSKSTAQAKALQADITLQVAKQNQLRASIEKVTESGGPSQRMLKGWKQALADSISTSNQEMLTLASLGGQFQAAGEATLVPKSQVQSFADSLNGLDNKHVSVTIDQIMNTPKGNPSSALNRIFHGASGGPIPGVGNEDTVPSLLMPGEFVVDKRGSNLRDAFRFFGAHGFRHGGPVASRQSQADISAASFRANQDDAALDKKIAADIRKLNQANVLERKLEKHMPKKPAKLYGKHTTAQRKAHDDALLAYNDAQSKLSQAKQAEQTLADEIVSMRALKASRVQDEFQIFQKGLAATDAKDAFDLASKVITQDDVNADKQKQYDTLSGMLGRLSGDEKNQAYQTLTQLYGELHNNQSSNVSSDLQAQLDQQRQLANSAQTDLANSQAQYAVLSGPNDIGAGSGANAIGSAQGQVVNNFHFSSMVAATQDQARSVFNAATQGGQYNGVQSKMNPSVVMIGA